MEEQILPLAYDPTQTTLVFGENRVTGLVPGTKFKDTGRTLEVFVQVTSQFLQTAGQGNKADFKLHVHAGNDQFVDIVHKQVTLDHVEISELDSGVPTVKVVFKK